MKYRKEIDGLRAIAVIPVILFHAGYESFSGGFIGVDVFFVISGYLITSLIIAEKESGTFSLINFYERRARRILPALFLVMFSCIPFAWMWLLPSDLKEFSESLVAVSGYFSNILFWMRSGYFSRAVELIPLIHTWSLSVEEQYYLLFPMIILLIWKFGKRIILSTLVILAIISLFLAQTGSSSQPIPTFYLLHSRIWELLIGSIAAFYYSTRPILSINTVKFHHQIFGVIGVLLIIYPILVFDKFTPYPSFYTLIPVIGATLIILYSSQLTLVGKLLSNQVFVSIGLISYSLYLWHQPIFAFARVRSIQQPSIELYIGLIILTIILAYFTWRFVETPFRNKKLFDRQRIFVFAITCSTFFITIGLVGYYMKGFANRIPNELISVIKPEKTNVYSSCKFDSIKDDPNINVCWFGSVDSNKTILLYGDSHAEALFSALDKQLKQRHIKGGYIGHKCHPIANIFSTYSGHLQDSTTCHNSMLKLLDFMKEADYVIIATRWTHNLYPIPSYIESLDFQNSEGGIEYPNPVRINYTLTYGGYSSDADGKRNAINDFLNDLTKNTKKLFLIYPIPEVGWDIPKYNYNDFLSGLPIRSIISTPYNDYKNRHAFVLKIFDDYGNRPNLIRIKPDEIFCNTFVEGRCVAQLNGVPLYYDDDHLSNEGARFVIDEIIKLL